MHRFKHHYLLPVSKLGLLLNNVLLNGGATILLGRRPLQLDVVFVVVHNLWFTWFAWWICGVRKTEEI